MREQKYINYIGPSMNPLFVDGDGLHIVPYEDQAVRPGDVIVFVPPGGGTKIVHRVVSCDARGVKTRGDNGKHVDPWVLTADNILGRVTYILRKNRRRSICGGFMGRLAAHSFRCLHFSNTVISILLHPVYHRLCRSTFLRRILRHFIKPRLLSFSRPEGVELQLVVGHRPIGRRRAGRGQWEIRRPFRLFVDEALLPGNAADNVTKKKCGRLSPCGERFCSARNSYRK